MFVNWINLIIGRFPLTMPKKTMFSWRSHIVQSKPYSFRMNYIRHGFFNAGSYGRWRTFRKKTQPSIFNPTGKQKNKSSSARNEPSSSIMGWYGVFGSVIFCLTGLFASISPRLASFHLTRPLLLLFIF